MPASGPGAALGSKSSFIASSRPPGAARRILAASRRARQPGAPPPVRASTGTFARDAKLPPLACKHPFTPKLAELILESVTRIVERRECTVKFACDHLWIPPNEWEDIRYECDRTVLSW